MQDQIDDTVELATFEAVHPLSWRAAAVGEYEQSLPFRLVELRTELAARILALTQQRISPEKIYASGRLAVAGVDGLTFRLYRGGDLALVRACACCATGHFESPQIGNLSDLGYAISAWRPLHEDCEEYSSEEFPDF